MTDEQLDAIENRQAAAMWIGGPTAAFAQDTLLLGKTLRDTRHLLRQAYNELNTIDAITVSPSDTDGLIELLRRIREHLGEQP